MRRGDCYRYAARRTMDFGGFYVEGTFHDIPHAWNEKDGLVRDYQLHGRRLPGHRDVLPPAMKDGIPRGEYAGIEHFRIRGARAVARRLLAEGYFGAWSEWTLTAMKEAATS
jgi:hypothetical protein